MALSLLLACATSVTAGSPAADLAAVDASWNRLRLTSDTDGLAALLLDDFVLTHSDGRVQRKNDYIADLRRGTRVNHGIENFDVEVRRHGDVAVVTGRTVQHGVGADGPFRGAFRFTRVWLLRDGAWKLLASHSARLPEPAPAAGSPR